LKIALALSGGGHRAAAFHLGVLKYLAEQELLENVSDISSTSGGSLLVAQLFHSANNTSSDSQNPRILAWPDSQTFLSNSLPYCKNQITQDSLENSFIKRMFSPKNWLNMGHRANLMARSLKKLWQITEPMKNLPEYPNWVINGTTNLSGCRWYVEKKGQQFRMGSKDLGIMNSADFPIADAIAISAAYPAIIGPYRLKFNSLDVYLSDGGLYDNLGLEPLFDIERRQLNPDVEAEILLVSDAGMSIQHKRLAPFWRPLLRTLRLIDVINHQVRSLRLRTLLPFLENNPEKGRYLSIDTNNNENPDLPSTLQQYAFLTTEKVEQAKGTATSLASLSDDQFENLVRHGYETALVQFSQLSPHGNLG
jgi:NTE family protein